MLWKDQVAHQKCRHVLSTWGSLVPQHICCWKFSKSDGDLVYLRSFFSRSSLFCSLPGILYFLHHGANISTPTINYQPQGLKAHPVMKWAVSWSSSILAERRSFRHFGALLSVDQTQHDKSRSKKEKKLYSELYISNLTWCPANFVQVLGRALCGDEGEQCIFGEALFVPDPVIDV